MAFAYAVTSRCWLDRKKRLCWGTFTNGATDTGGAIVTGMKTVDFFTAQPDSHVDSTMIKHTISGGTVTIVASDGVDGRWMALGT